MSIAYKKLIMGRTVKFIEIKLCKSCNKNLNYKNFRIVKPLTKVANKGKLVAWTDIIVPKKGYIPGNLVIVSDK